jgi:hypothetical protein
MRRPCHKKRFFESMQMFLHAFLMTGSCVSETIVPSNLHFKSFCHCNCTHTLLEFELITGEDRATAMPRQSSFWCYVSTQRNGIFKTINTPAWTYFLKRELYVRIWSNKICHTLNATVLTPCDNERMSQKGWSCTWETKNSILTNPVNAIVLTFFDISTCDRRV